MMTKGYCKSGLIIIILYMYFGYLAIDVARDLNLVVIVCPVKEMSSFGI